jgi:hypothetical protein
MSDKKGDKGKEPKDEGDKNVFAKATPEQRAVYRAQLDAADAEGGSVDESSAGWPAALMKDADRARSMSPAEMEDFKSRALAFQTRKSARERIEADDRRRADTHIERVDGAA